jgi:hypothetical protein
VGVTGPDPEAARTDREREAATADPASDDDGPARYCYCAVALDDADGAERTLDLTGLDDEPVRLLADGDVGVLVHDCSGLYDSADPTEVQGWLLSHQAVVDAADERFGTPVPFRFDTVVHGDDDAVRSWLADRRGWLASVLDDVAGRSEYHVEVLVDAETLDADIVATDDRLAELAERREAAADGTAFLLEKQYEDRLREHRRERRRQRTESLTADVEAHAAEVRPLEEPSTTLVDSGEGDDDEETQARLTLLADEAGASAVGEVLDDVVEEPGVAVRFTGPWPPYSFVPSVDDVDAEGGGTDGAQ